MFCRAAKQHLEDRQNKQKKNRQKTFYTDSMLCHSHRNAALYSSQQIGPCVTRLGVTTIIDDRGEDCYAQPVQDAIRDRDWEPLENVSDT